MARVRVLDWNGKDLPSELRALPAGQYVIEELGSVPKLSPSQEEGLRKALESARAGKTRSSGEVFARIDKLIASRARAGVPRRRQHAR